PELAALANHAGEVVAYAVGSHMGSRSSEAQNPLYLPQATVEGRSSSAGPAAALALEADPVRPAVPIAGERSGAQLHAGKRGRTGAGVNSTSRRCLPARLSAPRST